MPHQPTRFCIKQNSVDFSCGESRVYRTVVTPSQLQAVDQLDVLRRIRQQKREAVAAAKPLAASAAAMFWTRSWSALKETAHRRQPTPCVACNTGCRPRRMNVDHVPLTARELAPL